MRKRIKVAWQYLLPKRWITQIFGWVSEKKGGCVTRWIIALFIRCYRVDMREAKITDITRYPTFNSFFIRKLRDHVRPIDTHPLVLVMPADGILFQFGVITGEKVFQAKGYHYQLEALLGGNRDMVNTFRNGIFTSIYLSPSDYHRVHMPCSGVLKAMLYVPGYLFSVNPTDNLPNVFTRNERLICLFDTDFGPIIQILVGALLVGSIETIWENTITPPHSGSIKLWKYATNEVVLSKGQEMGRFKLGSTVINLFTVGRVILSPHLHHCYVTRVGQRLAYGIEHTDN